MAIVIDATKGGSAANSYATIEEADAYLETEIGAEEWMDLATDDKAKLLVTATRMIDGLSTLYSSIDPDQALNFPLENTSGDGAGDGFTGARVAAIIQAFYLHNHQDGILEGEQLALQGVRSATIGPTNKVMSGLNPFRRFDSRVYKLLKYHVDLDFKTRGTPPTSVLSGWDSIIRRRY